MANTEYYYFFGGLSLLYLGHRLLLDSLQQNFEEDIKKLTSKYINLPRSSFAFGFFITLILQSLKLSTSIGMSFVKNTHEENEKRSKFIFGASIGATLLVWFFTNTYFQLAFLLLIFGVLPRVLTNQVKYIHLGNVLTSIGLMFLGALFFKAPLEIVENSQFFKETIQYLYQQGWVSNIYAFIMGLIVAVLFESSNLAIILTLITFSTGIIPLDFSLKIVMGANLGGGLSLLIHGLKNQFSDNAISIYHFLFKLFGCIIFYFFLKFFDFSLIPTFLIIPFAHTLFNVMTCVLLILINPLWDKIAGYMISDIPLRKTLISQAQDLLPASALQMGDLEVKKLALLISRLFRLSKSFIFNQKTEQFEYEAIKQIEIETDRIHQDLNLFISHLFEKSLSPKQVNEAQNLIALSQELETIADYIERASFYKYRFNFQFTDESLKKEFFEFYTEIENIFSKVLLKLENNEVTIPKDFSILLKEQAEGIRESHLLLMGNKTLDPLKSMTLADIAISIRRIRAPLVNIVKILNSL